MSHPSDPPLVGQKCPTLHQLQNFDSRLSAVYNRAAVYNLVCISIKDFIEEIRFFLFCQPLPVADAHVCIKPADVIGTFFILS